MYKVKSKGSVEGVRIPAYAKRMVPDAVFPTKTAKPSLKPYDSLGANGAKTFKKSYGKKNINSLLL